MDTSRIFRKRYFPEELIELKKDRQLFVGEHMLITSWKTLKPRKDLASGVSLYLPEEGWKISRMYGVDGSFLEWYCDLIEAEPHPDGGTVFVDLLIDVVRYPNGTVQVLDLGEAGEMMEQGVVPANRIAVALRNTEPLLNLIQGPEFAKVAKVIENAEQGIFPKTTATFSDLLRES